MSSNSEVTREDVKGPVTPTISQSSTAIMTSTLKSNNTIELQDPPLLAGTAAKRLQRRGRSARTVSAPAGDLQPVASLAPAWLVHASLPDANRGSYLRLLGGGQCHPVVLSVHRLAAHPHPPGHSLPGHVQRGAGAVARLPAKQQGFRHPQLAVSGQRAEDEVRCCRSSCC